MNTAIIIPTYNEKENISRIIPYIFNEILKKEEISIIVVDSASPDGTAEYVETLQKEYKNLYLIKQKSKQGLASAYIDGFKYALKKNFDVLIQMDSDFQHPPEILSDCIKKIKEYDLVIASRYIDNGSWSNDRNKLKEIISNLGNFYISCVLKTNISDMTGGYNIWSRKALESINFDKIISKGFLFQIEMKYNAYKNNMKILEYPFEFRKRASGKSKMDWKIILEALFLIWKIKFNKN